MELLAQRTSHPCSGLNWQVGPLSSLHHGSSKLIKYINIYEISSLFQKSQTCFIGSFSRQAGWRCGTHPGRGMPSSSLAKVFFPHLHHHHNFCSFAPTSQLFISLNLQLYTPYSTVLNPTMLLFLTLMMLVLLMPLLLLLLVLFVIVCCCPIYSILSMLIEHCSTQCAGGWTSGKVLALICHCCCCFSCCCC